MGCVVFSPLEQGLLTRKYLGEIPDNSRAAKDHFLKRNSLTEDRLSQISSLNDLAMWSGQSLAQMTIAWVLRKPIVSSAIVGASRAE